MKFLSVLVFALFAIAFVAAFPSVPTDSIISALESSKHLAQTKIDSTPLPRKPFVPHTGTPNHTQRVRNVFIAAAGAFITKIVKNIPK